MAMRLQHAAPVGLAVAGLLLFLTVQLHGGHRVELLSEKQQDFWKDEEGLFGVEGKAWEHSHDLVRAATSSSSSPLKQTKLLSAPAQKALARSKKIADAQHTIIEQQQAKSKSKNAVKMAPAAAKSAAGEKRHLPVQKPLGDFSVPVSYKGVNVDKVYNKAWKAAFNAAYSSAYDSAMQKEEDRLWRKARAGEKARKELDAIERQRENKHVLHPQSVLAATDEDAAHVPDAHEAAGAAPTDAEEEERPVTWGAVPLGAKHHMRSGPEYTGGKEHYGPLQVHCAGGNCDNLERAGVNVDAWKGLMFGNVERTVPFPGFDPSEDMKTRIAQNTRTGRFAKYYKGRDDDNPGWGGGAQSYDDPTAYRLEQHGVKVDSTHGLYKAVPLPVWDHGQFDHKAKGGRSPFFSAEEALKRNRESDESLEKRGVAVNRMPAASLGKPYAHVDGVADRLVAAPAMPVWRKEGVVADAEQPGSFLLRDDGGELLNEPQWQHDDHGLEVKGAPATELQGDLTRAGVLVDSWPGGHLGNGATSTWCSKGSWDCTSTNPASVGGKV